MTNSCHEGGCLNKSDHGGLLGYAHGCEMCSSTDSLAPWPYPESVLSALPDDYKAFEYIESTGTQYINTGYDSV